MGELFTLTHNECITITVGPNPNCARSHGVQCAGTSNLNEGQTHWPRIVPDHANSVQTRPNSPCMLQRVTHGCSRFEPWPWDPSAILVHCDLCAPAPAHHVRTQIKMAEDDGGTSRARSIYA